MNTLSKKYTSKFFKSQEEYDNLKKYWSTLVNSEEKDNLTATHHLVYLVLMGKDWRKAFIPSSKAIRWENGYKPGIDQAIIRLNYAVNSSFYESNITKPFGGLVTHEMLVEVRNVICKPNISEGIYFSDAYLDL